MNGEYRSDNSKRGQRFATSLKNQRGLTLLELTITFAIGLFIAVAVTQVFTSNKGTSLLNLELAKIQESGRYAIDTMVRDLRLTDNWGCAGLDSVVSHTTNFDLNETVKITNQDSPATDRLDIKGAMQINRTVASISADFDGDEAIPVTIMNEDKLKAFASFPLMISDCENSDIFDATVLENSIQTGTTLSKAYDQRAFLYRPFTLSYYVNAQKQLLRQYNGIETPIADGVSDFQVQYGIDTNPGDDEFSASIYKPNPSAAELPNIASIRINLLMESEEDIVQGEPQEYSFNWEEKLTAGNGGTVLVKANDKKLRKAFTSIIAVRNRIK